MSGWTAVEEELARWADRGRRCPLWLRDDDAVAASPALDRLLRGCAAAGVPLGIAAIPADATPSLPEALAGQEHAALLVHGWAHADHASPHGKKCEFGPQRPADVRQAEAERGLAALRALCGPGDAGPRVLPLFVPPWNRMAPDMPGLLAAAGYRAVSAFGPPPPGDASGLRWLNTHLDLIDWRGSRSAVALDALLDALCRELRDRREGTRDPDEPIGLLTHHRVHDAAIWDLLDHLLDRLAGHRSVCWPPVATLLPPA
ncbi:polysaccharide deacetylase family protein [Azospirillum sp. TSO35-2]|uniref:polysaccharide deacetylase family protein n=1 Tax=Azospirillum sp. TSO35-2 TaxID=716796 RepID=UPI000D60B202|nr:polysaccharide deacetylase family protein [Azospirillum sp. TSO35-2]PWC32689.1 hypothetical protein TSO352_18830 [Azospirillum sp. TSO35-2]